jgi:hypothetical protein
MTPSTDVVNVPVDRGLTWAEVSSGTTSKVHKRKNVLFVTFASHKRKDGGVFEKVLESRVRVIPESDRRTMQSAIEFAATHLFRTGPPTGDWGGVRFSVPEKLDTGHVVWRHHARCRNYE